MKILVTGGAGFIGSHVVDALLQEGHEVLVIDDLSTGKLENVNSGARLKRMDIRSPGLRSLLLSERPDIVNHHAAHVDVRASVADPSHDMDINIRGTLNLLECSREAGVKKFIYASSGGAIYGEPDYLPVDESHPARPICPYGVSKYTPELYLFMYARVHGLNYSVLRYPNIYGPRQDPSGEAGVVAIFAGKMLRGEDVTINGTGEQERDFLFIDDVVRANLLCLEKGDGGVYNLGWGEGVSVNDIFERLARITGYTKRPQHGPPKAGETFRIYLDASKARRELGWTPSVRLDEGLKRTVEFISRRGGAERSGGV